MAGKAGFIASTLVFYSVLIWGQSPLPKRIAPDISNAKFTVSFTPAHSGGFVYRMTNGPAYSISLPEFEIDGQRTDAVLKNVSVSQSPVKLRNGVIEHYIEGVFAKLPSLRLRMSLQVSEDNPVLRFRYKLITAEPLKLTKSREADAITYLKVRAPSTLVKEVRLSQFNERFHATHLTEDVYTDRHFDNNVDFMGPIAVMPGKGHTSLVAYEHGSQYPDRFISFSLDSNRQIRLQAVKANYMEGDSAAGFESAWFHIAAVAGDEQRLATEYRRFILKYLSQNPESRKPYIFYNTWGRQERVQWRGGKYLTSMNLEQTLKEIDRAHALGVEVFVIDAGWFTKTGDWEVNARFFPDSLRQVKQKLDGYKMKLGLWFNPTVAALSSTMYQRNIANRMTRGGQPDNPREIWETENSVGLCLVSSYWEDFANKLISLSQTLGVTYFKWDAIGQYGCDDANHFHGGRQHTVADRSQRYAYLQPFYMARIVDKLCAAVPQAIVDFDITEEGRCVGLQFLSAGKYFIINNGPYYHNFDLAPAWKSVLPSGNANIFVEPGPARGWFVRSVLDYDKWIPSVLFLTHYQPDEPRGSQLINMASLVLGQNGIWGEILKTSDSGVVFMRSILDIYKKLRDDITAAAMVRGGEPGESPEIYEKINPHTGKGCIVMFGNAAGTYTYVTKNKIDAVTWQTEGTLVRRDAQGRGVITVSFQHPSASIVFVGAK